MDDHALHAWAAGFYEGEGCVYAAKGRTRHGKPQPRICLSIAQANREPLERFAQVIGGRISKPKVPRVSANVIGKKPIYELCILGTARVNAALDLMKPWLSVAKREQVGRAFARYTELGGKETRPREEYLRQIRHPTPEARRLAQRAAEARYRARKRLLTATVALLCVLAAFAASASARGTTSLTDSKVGVSKPELLAQIRYSGNAVRFFTVGKGRWMIQRRHESCLTVKGRPGLLCFRARDALRAHVWLHGLAQRRYERLYVHPVPAVCQGASAAACEWYFDGATQCEVSHEGWFTTDSNSPYAGRFQMDETFERGTTLGKAMQARYGRASHWPPWAQIEHAYEVWTVRGWGPWPPYYNYGCARWKGGTFNGVAPFVAASGAV